MLNIKQAIENRNNYITKCQEKGEFGIACNYSEFDRLTDGGFKDGDVIVLGANSSVGKTQLALNLLYNSCGNRVNVLFSLEMSSRLIVNRLLSIASGRNSIVDLKTTNSLAEISEIEQVELKKAQNTLSNKNIVIYDDMRQFDSIANSLRELDSQLKKDNKRIGLVVIDYLTMIEGFNNSPSENLRVGKISKELKKLAMEMKVPMLVLAQLNRNNNNRVSKKPVLSDLKDSGAIEQDADMVILLYREGYFNKDKKLQEEIAINGYQDVICDVAKNRNGETKEITLKFISDKGIFYE